MRSCVYSTEVFHKRFAPSVHAFNYRLDYLLLDLSEIDELCALSPFWSNEANNLISVKRADYLPGKLPLDQQVRQTIIDLGGSSVNGRICLLSTPRRLWHCMNPISLFYCYETPSGTEVEATKTEQLKYVVAEVHNTPWDERHVYLLQGPDFETPTPKSFHVSPFMPMNTTYEWNISDPAATARVAITVTHNANPLFRASMNMQKVEIDPETIAGITRRQLAQSFLTASGIYLQALKLWLKKVPFYRHPNKGLNAK